ncbi:MAG TPA: hypothetical protein VG713_07675 [Pirellulales bacterium]|nr:hypothetical protein [Pirellulales bacterium]
MSLCDLPNLWPAFRQTTWLPSVHERCLLAVQRRVRSLALPGLADESVVVQRLPWARDFVRQPPHYEMPGVIVSVWGTEQMNPLGGSNLVDQVTYPVCITIVAADRPYFTGFDVFLWWRERLSRAFRDQPLAGVGEVLNCIVEPGEIVAPNALLRGVLHSSLMLRFTSNEAREV